MNSEKIILSQTEHQKISQLVFHSKSEVAELLQEELDRADLVPDQELPGDVVSMFSQVVYRDQDTQRETRVTLVYPEEADSESGKISILAPIGAALIGLRAGQQISWPLPHDRQKRIEIVSVEKTI